MKILHIVPGINGGGIGTVIYNYYSHMDRKNIQFELAVMKADTPEKEKELFYPLFRKLGTSLYYIGSRRDFRSYVRLYRLLKKRHYDAVHVHDDEWSTVYCIVARAVGIPVRISHSHTVHTQYTRVVNRILRVFLKKVLKTQANYYFSCSKGAALSLYGSMKKVHILNNAIDISAYSYNKETREQVRRRLQVESRFVVGHVGRFCYEKNHEFLIDIFSELRKINDHAVLLLVGDGTKKKEIEEKVRSLNLTEYVIFYGNTPEVPAILQAMDVFVFPSIQEGMPLSTIEAQAASVHTFCSRGVPRKVGITQYCHFLNLSDGAAEWAKMVNSYDYSYSRSSEAEPIIEAGFDIRKEARKFEKFYMEVCGK